jgi:hypothetical protein
MKRTTLTASLVGSAAAGLIAAAIATPAWAQATTYPEGTDCSAIQNSASKQDCMQQLNESRQVPAPGTTTTTDPGAVNSGNINPSPQNAPLTNAPAGTGTTTTPNGITNGTTPGANTPSTGTGTGTTGTGTTTP